MAKKQGESLYSIAEEMKRKDYPATYELKPNEKLGFVFPIYAWAPPKMVLDFIRHIKLDGYKDQYVFTVFSCGDEAGYALNVLIRALDSVNIGLSGGFSVQMPNNYMIMGFNVDSKEVEQKKLTAAVKNLAYINEAISMEQNIFEYEKGRFPFLKTKLANPVFNAFGRSSRPFHTLNSCTSCGLCERICPTQNIGLVDGKPQWKGNCTQCFACINRCPACAIQHGRKTVDKGRYCHPFVFK